MILFSNYPYNVSYNDLNLAFYIKVCHTTKKHFNKEADYVTSITAR